MITYCVNIMRIRLQPLLIKNVLFLRMKPYLPDEFKGKASSSAKRILEIHSKLIGQKENDAKYEYVKLARSLPTFGVHFFLVREAKNKRMFPLLFGVKKDSILRLDYETKETIETFPLTTIKHMASTARIFSVDFGTHSTKNLTVQTTEGVKIKNLINDYIKMNLESKF